MEHLEAQHFPVFKDEFYEFKYVRKVVSEPEKKNPTGSNTRCHGVILDLILTDTFNPFELFTTYMELLPNVANKSGKFYLFPKA